MRLYLVQHGEAKTKAQDPERPLTERGAATAYRVAAWASAAGVGVSQIRHSGKRRAEETAEAFAKHLGPAGGVIAVDGLGPNDDVRPTATSFQDEDTDVMLVGHMPFLSRLAGTLIAGDAERQIVRFRNSGIVCLSRDDGGWSLDWSVPPEHVQP